MRHCFVLVAVAWLAAVPVAGQKTWTPPLTPYGQPDLQGVWENKSATPLERPKELAGRPFLTDQEVAELKNLVEAIIAKAEKRQSQKV